MLHSMFKKSVSGSPVTKLLVVLATLKAQANIYKAHRADSPDVHEPCDDQLRPSGKQPERVALPIAHGQLSHQVFQVLQEASQAKGLYHQQAHARLSCHGNYVKLLSIGTVLR